MADGTGQCHTKSTLLMASLRAVGISWRFHGFTISKPLWKASLQRHFPQARRFCGYGA